MSKSIGFKYQYKPVVGKRPQKIKKEWRDEWKKKEKEEEEMKESEMREEERRKE